MPRKENTSLGGPKTNSRGCTRGDTDQDDNLPEKKDGFFCPVCGKPVSQKYLPDEKGFIDERLYFFDDFRVIAGTVLECDFYHFYDEEKDTTLEEPHDLVAVVNVAFDESGECTAFDIVKVRAADKIAGVQS